MDLQKAFDGNTNVIQTVYLHLERLLKNLTKIGERIDMQIYV